MKKYEKIIIVGDHHIPYNDENTQKNFLKFLKDFKPDTLVINGDLLDFYDLSNFDKDLLEEGVLQEELDKGIKLLKTYRSILPNAKIYLTTSNHMEKRLEKFKKNVGRAIYSLRYFSIQEMLQLDKFDIESVDFLKYKNFMIYHGNIVRKHSSYTGKSSFEDKGKSVFINHTHRLGSYYKTDESGEHVAVECGCMCNLNPEYIDGTPNWQQGFAVIYRDTTSDWFQHYLIPIIENKFLFEGKEYKLK